MGQRGNGLRDRVEEADARARTLSHRRSGDTDSRRHLHESADLEPDRFVQRSQPLLSVGKRDAGPEELRDGAICDRPLARIAPAGKDRPAFSTDVGRQRLGETRLADPGLTLDDREVAISRRRLPRRDQPRQLIRPAGKWGHQGLVRPGTG